MSNKPSIVDWIYIVGLSAIWGSSFVFIKETAPVFGPVGLVFLRLSIASIVLGLLFINRKDWLFVKDNLFPILIIGAANIAIPFYLFSYASLQINAGSMAVINGTTPLFAFLFSMMFLNFKFKLLQLLGIVMGLIGLTVFVGLESLEFEITANLAAIMGAMMYGISMVYMYKLNFENVKLIAAVSMLGATFLITPFLALEPLTFDGLNLYIILSTLFLAVLATGLAYIPYYTLIKSIGPVSTSIIAMLVPVFGMFWAYILLDESVTLTKLFGCFLIITGVLMTNLGGNKSSKES